MDWHVEDRGPIAFGDLRLDNQRGEEREIAARMIERLAGTDPQAMTFMRVRVPVVDLIESAVIEAVVREKLDEALYVRWRERGAPADELHEWFENVAAARRADPASAGRLAGCEVFARLFEAGEPVDPLIAARYHERLALSSGNPALLVLDGRHRWFAAAECDLPDLPVYVSLP